MAGEFGATATGTGSQAATDCLFFTFTLAVLLVLLLQLVGMSRSLKVTSDMDDHSKLKVSFNNLITMVEWKDSAKYKEYFCQLLVVSRSATMISTEERSRSGWFPHGRFSI